MLQGYNPCTHFKACGAITVAHILRPSPSFIPFCTDICAHVLQGHSSHTHSEACRAITFAHTLRPLLSSYILYTHICAPVLQGYNPCMHSEVITLDITLYAYMCIHHTHICAPIHIRTHTCPPSHKLCPHPYVYTYACMQSFLYPHRSNPPRDHIALKELGHHEKCHVADKRLISSGSFGSSS